MTILLFIAVLFINVLFHEWGHFIVAKKSGMRVDEFGFGLPPRIFSWGKGETKYSINALPIGGFVKIPGENGEKTDGRGFSDKPWYAQVFVLIAGVVANTILAFVLFSVAYMIGTPAIQEGGVPTVLYVAKGGAAESAGISVNDVITSVRHKETGVSVSPISTDSLREVIASYTGEFEFTIVSQNKKEKIISVTPISENGSYKVGLSIESVGIEKYGFFESFVKGGERTIVIMKGVLSALGTLVEQVISPNPSVANFIGPVGLAKEVKNASLFGIGYLISFIAIISANLAVLNIMPFPALDGGRLVIVLIEAIIRRKIPSSMVSWIHFVGFVLLIILMIALTKQDLGF